MFSDTIAAISTATGAGAIAIVRMSGDGALEIADKIFRGKVIPSEAQSHQILFGKVVDCEAEIEIDEVLISVFRAPKSYTTEDMVEIQCHGGSLTPNLILKTLIRSGARLALPGEFTKRAFLADRIDLAQAEAVADLINSKSILSQKTALFQLHASLSKKIEKVRSQLLQITAQLEYNIDFPDEDDAPVEVAVLLQSIEEIRGSIEELLKSAESGEILRNGMTTVIAGLPNVGKSSLFNLLLQKERAIVHDQPGTTRDALEAEIDIEGITFRLVDTAGLKDSNTIVERKGIEFSHRYIDSADLVLFIADSTEGLSDIERKYILDWREQRRIALVFNKIDLNGRFKEDTSNLGVKYVEVSAVSGQGYEELKSMLAGIARVHEIDPTQPIVTRERHRVSLEKALGAVDHIHDGLKGNISPELLAVDVRTASNALSEIIGTITTDEILDQVFSAFCVGK